MAAMEALEPGLYMGTLPDCLEEQFLREASITALVCCMSSPPAASSIDETHTLHVPLDELETAPLFLYFGTCARFIKRQLDEHGHVLVFGADGEACHVTIVAAYLIHTRQRTASQALEFLRARCPTTQVPASFCEQLELYEKEQGRVNLTQPAVRQFLLTRTNALEGYVTPGMLIRDHPDTQNDPYSDPVETRPPVPESAGTTRLRCKMCRRELASEEHVVPHEPGKGELSFDPHKRDSVRKGLDKAPVARQRGSGPAVPPSGPGPAAVALPPHLARIHSAMAMQGTRKSLLHSARCSAYFVEPLVWMTESSDVVEGVISGRLMCPNTKCQAKLGSWTWAGTQCACGAWVTPAFALQRAKVDEVVRP
ncbi:hypothetical protein MCAP1_002991 [Malassezia caprae]|uniref:protein-tyrosine-phosphatase n=1 Tax=Malassezia caprae TaxID=1381934 RepID=A0AAF0IWE9_9BASI|nr:hypothetical protein MCAP1_002991 [Malassezia caprae]